MDEKSARNQAKDEVLQLSFKLEVLKKEYDTLVNNLDTERSFIHAAKVRLGCLLSVVLPHYIILFLSVNMVKQH